MTLPEFKTLASAMGATYVYERSSGAVFTGTRYNVTLELTQAQLQEAKPVELAYVMADYALLN